jgi:CheY-like chemotaxis protein
VVKFAVNPHSRSILLVENDALVRADIARMLVAEGHRIAKACDAHQGAGAILHESFDLLIIDVLFPGMRTIEALVARSRQAGRARILGLCRFNRLFPDYYLSLSARLGVRVILARPFNGPQLAAAIGEAFDEEIADRDRWPVVAAPSMAVA